MSQVGRAGYHRASDWTWLHRAWTQGHQLFAGLDQDLVLLGAGEGLVTDYMFLYLCINVMLAYQGLMLTTHAALMLEVQVGPQNQENHYSSCSCAQC